MRVTGAKRPGRGHRARGDPCQDSFAVWESPDGSRVAAAVADGLGSRPLSQFGSQAACDAAVASLAAEPADGAGGWDGEALRRAFQAARDAVAAAAAERGLAAEDLATTLQVATLDRATGRAWAGMVGDGAIVAAGTGSGEAVRILAAPGTEGYSNEVTPLTADWWADDLQLASLDGARAVLLFTDGLTRLLLSRARPGWQPFSPFFQAFLPQLSGPAFNAALAASFLGADDVDKSWDDDKCLVAIALAADESVAVALPEAGVVPEAPHA